VDGVPAAPGVAVAGGLAEPEGLDDLRLVPVRGILLGAAVVLGLIVWSQARTIGMLNADLIAEQQRYGACSGRLTSILDTDRDDEIDALDLNALRERASGWLRNFGTAD